MAQPLYHPCTSRNKKPTEGQDGFMRLQAEEIPQAASLHLGSQTCLNSTGASSGLSTTGGLFHSLVNHLVTTSGETSSTVDKGTDTSAIEDESPQVGSKDISLTSIQHEELISSGIDKMSYPMASISASVEQTIGQPDTDNGSCSLDWLSDYKTFTADNSSKHFISFFSNCESSANSSSKKGRDMTGIPGLGDSENPVSDQPDTPPQPNQNNCSLTPDANILSHFGLDEEDLEHLISYPQELLTHTNLPIILHQIRLQKTKRAASVQSKADTEYFTSRGTTTFEGLSSSTGSRMQQNGVSSAVDQLHTSGFGEFEAASGGSNILVPNTYSGNNPSNELLPDDTSAVKSSHLESYQDQASSVTNMSSAYSSLLSFESSTTQGLKKPSQTEIQPTFQLINSSGFPKKDTTGTIATPESPKCIVLRELQADHQPTLKTQSAPICSAQSGTMGFESNNGKGMQDQRTIQGRDSTDCRQEKGEIQHKKPNCPTSFFTKNPTSPDSHIPDTVGVSGGMPRAGFIPWILAVNNVLQQTVQTKQNASAALQPSHSQFPERVSTTKDLPTPAMMSDCAGAVPNLFPHTCSLCNTECTQFKDWLSHKDTGLHLQNCKLLKQSKTQSRSPLQDSSSSCLSSTSSQERLYQKRRRTDSSPRRRSCASSSPTRRRSCASSSPSSSPTTGRRQSRSPARGRRRGRSLARGRRRGRSPARGRCRGRSPARGRRRGRSPARGRRPSRSTSRSSTSRSPTRSRCTSGYPTRNHTSRSPNSITHERNGNKRHKSGAENSYKRWSPKYRSKAGLDYKICSSQRRSPQRWSHERTSRRTASHDSSQEKPPPKRWRHERTSRRTASHDSSQERPSPQRWSHERTFWGTVSHDSSQERPSSQMGSHEKISRRTASHDSSQERPSPQRWSHERQSPQRRMDKLYLKRKVYKRLSPETTNTESRSSGSQSLQTNGHELESLKRGSPKRRSPLKKSHKKQSLQRKHHKKESPKKQSPQMSKHDKRLSKGTSPSKQKKMSTAEKLAKKLLTPALKALAQQPDVDAVVETMTPALMSELIKMTVLSSSSSSLPAKRKRSSSKVKKKKSTKSSTKLKWNSKTSSSSKKVAKSSHPALVKLRCVPASLTHEDLVAAVQPFAKTKSVLFFHSKQDVHPSLRVAHVYFNRKADAQKLKRIKILTIKGYQIPVSKKASVSKARKKLSQKSDPVSSPSKWKSKKIKPSNNKKPALGFMASKCSRSKKCSEPKSVTSQKKAAKSPVKSPKSIIKAKDLVCKAKIILMRKTTKIKTETEEEVTTISVDRTPTAPDCPHDVDDLEEKTMASPAPRSPVTAADGGAAPPTNSVTTKSEMDDATAIKTNNAVSVDSSPCEATLIAAPKQSEAESACWSNAAILKTEVVPLDNVTELESLRERLLIVEICNTSLDTVRVVKEMVTSIAPVIRILPLANRICIEMVSSRGLTKVLDTYRGYSPSVREDCVTWTTNVGRFESVDELHQRLQNSTDIPINLNTSKDVLEALPSSVKLQTLHKNKELLLLQELLSLEWTEQEQVTEDQEKKTFKELCTFEEQQNIEQDQEQRLEEQGMSEQDQEQWLEGHRILERDQEQQMLEREQEQQMLEQAQKQQTFVQEPQQTNKEASPPASSTVELPGSHIPTISTSLDAMRRPKLSSVVHQNLILPSAALKPVQGPVHIGKMLPLSNHKPQECFPTPVMMCDYAAVTPKNFPHKCSLCNMWCTNMKVWLLHQNSSFHLQSCKSLRKRYPLWGGDVKCLTSFAGSQVHSKKSYQKSRSRSRSRSRLPSPTHHVSGNIRENCSSRHSSPSSKCETQSSQKTSHSRVATLAKKLLKSSAAQSLSCDSNLEAVAETLAPVLMTELAKWKPSSSSVPSLPTGGPLSAKKKKLVTSSSKAKSSKKVEKGEEVALSSAIKA
ncbi:uncharacterized protein LOC117505251 [Thalassophryne amazonica]|uniref:uncharacterized protein LOC117505251 n=1 Tax=Thalassophryne amazonica TaxID=390379 RepID=UPI001471056E|nr:uncharacterized protein LOC117505251 [Thalassophryne amazonica]